MLNMFKSELLKVKNTFLYLICLGDLLLTLLLSFLVYEVAGSVDTTVRNEVFISLFSVIQIIVSVMNTHLFFSLEKSNKFQNILSVKKFRQLWAIKIGVMVTIQQIFAMTSLFGVRLICGDVFSLKTMSVAVLLQVLAVTNMHMLLISISGEIGNLLLGILEVILSIFATNIPMRSIWQYFPSTYGYKIWEYYNQISSKQWLTVGFICLGLFFLNLILMKNLISDVRLKTVKRKK